MRQTTTYISLYLENEHEFEFIEFQCHARTVKKIMKLVNEKLLWEDAIDGFIYKLTIL